MRKQREIKLIHFSLPSSHIDELEARLHCPSSRQLLEVVQRSHSGVAQLALLHQLKTSVASLTDPPAVLLESLAVLILQVDEQSINARNILEKILTESVPPSHHKVLVTLLSAQFQRSLQEHPPTCLDHVQLLTRQMTPCLTGFHLGFQALVPSIPLVLEFCQESLVLINKLLTSGCLEDSLPPLCQQLLRLLFKLVLSPGLPDWQLHSVALSGLAAQLHSLLSHKHLWLNCQLNGCIALCSIMAALAKDRAQLLQSVRNQPVPAVQASCQLSIQISFLAGWMTVLQGDPLCSDLVVHTFLPHLLQVSSRSEVEPLVTLARARTLEQALSLLVSKLPLSTETGNKLRPLLPTVFDFLWVQWEHQVEGIGRHLQASLKSGVQLIQHLSDDPNEALSKLVQAVLALPSYKACRYRALSGLVALCGATQLLAWRPQLPADLLAALADPAIAGHVADALLEIFTSLPPDSRSACLQPLLESLLAASPAHATAIYENVLPKLFRQHPVASEHLLRQLLALRDDPKAVPVVAHCLRRWLTSSNRTKIFDTELEPLIGQALKHSDAQVRLDGLALLCLNGSPASALPRLLQVLPAQLDCPSPALRQELLALLKKYFQRLAEGGSLLKKSGDQNGSQQQLLADLRQLLLSFLQPTSNFGHRYLALQLLNLIPATHNGYTPAQLQLLVECLKDPYEENKQAALTLLSNLGPSCVLGPEYLQRLYNQGLELVRSSRPTACVTAGYLMCLVATDSLLPGLVAELSRQLALAEDSLLEAATVSPLYGVLTCLRLVLSHGTNRLSQDQWQKLVTELFALCQRTVAVVGPVVCSDSPEGFLPPDTSPEQLQELIAKAGLGKRQSTTALSTVKTQAIAAQLLLLCAWRSHKEVSLLLGDLAGHLPQSLQVSELGSFLINQLMVVQHKGAIENAYLGLTQVCLALWRLSPQEASQQATAWMGEMLDLIRTATTSPTRRGAGVPYVVQALLETEPGLYGHQLFHGNISQLLELAQTPNPARVHALNILRALYKNSHLGSRIRPYVADGIKAALIGFQELSWDVRNAATLLFSCLMTRIFGVNRSRNQDCHRKNRLTGRVFFQHYPSLHKFLLETFKKTLQTSVGLTSSAVLTPILILFSRLLPSALEGTDSDCSLLDFVPLALQCRSSPVWASRELSARALVNLLQSQTSVPACLEQLLQSTQHTPAPNLLHGSLLQIHAILREYGQTLEDRTQLLQFLEDFQINNHLLAIRVTYLDIFILCYSHRWIGPYEVWVVPLLRHLKMSVHLPGYKLYSPLYQLYSPLYHARAAECLLVVWAWQGLLHPHMPLLLESRCYEAQLAICDFLVQLLGGGASENTDVLRLGAATQAISDHPQLDDIRDWMLHSKYLAECLISILEYLEHYPPQLGAQAAWLAGRLPRCLKLPWFSDSDPCEKLAYLLELMELTDLDEIITALLHASSILVMDSRMIEQDSPEVSKWLSLLTDSVQPGKAVGTRMEVASLLLRHVASLRTFLFTDARSTAIWHCWVTLAVDDDPDIRSLVASTMSQLTAGVSSERSLPDSIFSLMSLQLGSRHPGAVLSALINWVVPSMSPADLDDEQPFDRGELNIYAEDLLLSRQAAVCLRRVKVGADMSIPSPQFLTTLGPSTTPRTVLDHCCRQVEHLASTLSSLNPWTSRDFDATVVQLSQRCLLLRELDCPNIPSVRLDYSWTPTPCLLEIFSTLSLCDK